MPKNAKLENLEVQEEIVQDLEVQEEEIDTRKLVVVNVPYIPGQPNYVVVWVGEENWKIKRGVDVEVPYCVYDVLRQSARAQAGELEYKENL